MPKVGGTGILPTRSSWVCDTALQTFSSIDSCVVPTLPSSIKKTHISARKNTRNFYCKNFMRNYLIPEQQPSKPQLQEKQ